MTEHIMIGAIIGTLAGSWALLLVPVFSPWADIAYVAAWTILGVIAGVLW